MAATRKKAPADDDKLEKIRADIETTRKMTGREPTGSYVAALLQEAGLPSDTELGLAGPRSEPRPRARTKAPKPVPVPAPVPKPAPEPKPEPRQAPTATAQPLPPEPGEPLPPEPGLTGSTTVFTPVTRVEPLPQAVEELDAVRDSLDRLEIPPGPLLWRLGYLEARFGRTR